MATIQIKRIDGTGADAGLQLAQVRDQLSAEAEVVSPRSRELTEKVFGAALNPSQVVERICADVRATGLKAVLRYTEAFDRTKLTAETVRVSQAELAKAHADADPAFLETVRRIRKNILHFQIGLVNKDAVLSAAGRHELRLRYRPMRRVGICVPGGSASYPSTLLMTVIPAQAAGVPELAVVMPPTAAGAANPDLLAVCHELGVSEVYRIGGAQAVAALAYGVDGIPSVDMIVGPGNIFVALAKRHVFGEVTIDCIAGPSEVIVIADDSAPAEFVASDMIAQAEHSPGVSLLVTWHAPLIEAVAEAIDRQLACLPRGDLARDSLESYGALVLVNDETEAVRLTNQLAPEHLHIATRNAETLADRIDCAGAIFIGHYSPVALGDYAAGPSHVLPTSGSARFTSGLSANDFLRRSSQLRFTPSGLQAMADDVRMMANKEGLTAHAASVDIRLASLNNRQGGETRQPAAAAVSH